MQQSIIGWDIGGAHIKAALLDTNGIIVKVTQQPCALWKGLEFLHQAVKQILNQLQKNDALHAITMTGELVDLFASRDHGVEQIIASMRSSLLNRKLLIYAGLNGFLTPEQLSHHHYASIASANWLASATLAASKQKQGLFIDIGSTTTDILVLAKQKVQAIGLTDYERMISDELVYTGTIRTAVMSVAQSASFQGHKIGLMAEYFATMADVYRLTGELNKKHDQTDTADGGEKTVLASAKRLSRMTAYEYCENDLPLWKLFAKQVKMQQRDKIRMACERQLSRGLVSEQDFFIGAGIGRFLVKQIADDLGFPYVDFNEFFNYKIDNKDSSKCFEMDAADCAPAVSIAALAWKFV